MRVILATNHLGLGGSESYLLTVAEQFDRLGHEPLLYTLEPGGGAAAAEQRGIPVVDPASLPPDCDAVLAPRWRRPTLSSGAAARCSRRWPAVARRTCMTATAETAG